ncbi:MAG: permease-like cell division protein FtsX [Myxococcota bacterium]|nr:permease-like cell division protein FtsX [Myxococcota bacterium]
MMKTIRDAVVVHRLFHILLRTVDGMRRRPWLHLLSLFTLSAAFLSFTATLTAAINVDGLLARWVGSAELTVYLQEGTDSAELTRLSSAIEKIAGVSRVEPILPDQARDQFADDLGAFGSVVKSIPTRVFPPTIDIHLKGTAARNIASRRVLAARLEKLETVAQVDIYDEWFERLSVLSLVGRLASWGLGFIALTVAILVVNAVVRAGLTARAQEIEVLGLIGATRGYIQLPFLLEGALGAVIAMGLALVGLHVLIDGAHGLIGELMPLVGVSSLVGLTLNATLLLLIGAMLVGLVGARLSLRGLTRA